VAQCVQGLLETPKPDVLVMNQNKPRPAFAAPPWPVIAAPGGRKLAGRSLLVFFNKFFNNSFSSVILEQN
jgi:hypothetical protein